MQSNKEVKEDWLSKKCFDCKHYFPIAKKKKQGHCKLRSDDTDAEDSCQYFEQDIERA